MNNIISSKGDYRNYVLDFNKLCGVCNSKIVSKDELSKWIKCESCTQGYHGNHILEVGKDGFCPICYGPLLVGVNLYLYEITGIESGQLQFQARKSTKTPSIQILFLKIFPFLLLFLGLGVMVSFPVSS
ncbi:MAG: hypothetical protein HeimC2_23520 [Candidatus Heimdallarchaeota archaeon LC_2]|nr:MAG: hypothetical protein HeimC2_23520 [Candidatus Heimdallarchaeota archaeon LC_2]